MYSAVRQVRGAGRASRSLTPGGDLFMRVRRGGSGPRSPSAATSSWQRTAGSLGEKAGRLPIPGPEGPHSVPGTRLVFWLRAASSKVPGGILGEQVRSGKNVTFFAFDLYSYRKQLTAPLIGFFNELPYACASVTLYGKNFIKRFQRPPLNTSL